MSVPLVNEGQCIGSLTLESSKENAFTADDIRYVELVATTATVTIAHHPEWAATQAKKVETDVSDIVKAQKADVLKLIADLKLQSIFAAINRIFSEFADITLSKTPIVTFERTLAAVLPRMCQNIGAEFGFILKDMGHKVKFQIYELYAEFDVPINYDAAYTFNEEEWMAMGEGKGVYISTIQQFDRRRTSYLPLDDWGYDSEQKARTEIAIIRVGGHFNDAQYVLAFGNEKAPKDGVAKAALSFHKQKEIFDLVALRLYEIYNIALHAQTQVEYDEDRRQFIQDVMHQLNSSLGSIKADVENLVDGIVPAAEYPAAFDRLYSLASMFQGYTKTFMLAANDRSILNVYRSAFTVFQSDDLVRFIKEQSNYFKGKAIHVQIDGPKIIESSFADFPPLTIHKDLFELVMFNLFDNAIKYSFEYANAPIVVEGRLRDDYAEIMITNHGIPLTQEDSTNVFNRFERSQEAINYVGMGTGIGLYLCQLIVEHHKGEIVALPSEPSKIVDGADEVRFLIRLPIDYQEDG